MKKRNILLLAGTLLLTATSIFQINNHPVVDSVIQQLSTQSDQEREEIVYLHLDRTFYRPGETVWFNAYVRDADNRREEGASEILNIEFYKPNGTVLDSFKLICQGGQGNGSITLPEQGGIYKIKAFSNWQKNTDAFFEKEIQVQQVLLPNLNMTLDFEKKAYGSKDEVIADLTLESLDNQVLRYTPFKYKVNLAKNGSFEGNGETDFDGKAKVKFLLPDSLKSNDGLLNVMIPYRGSTESISRSIPIVLNDIDLTFFPEGGDLVDGQKAMLAFEALNEFGKPADIDGLVEDSEGHVIAHFSSLHNGMGKFEIEGNKDRTYFAKITKPEGINKRYTLPKPLAKGTSISVLEQQKDFINIAVRTASKELLHLVAQAGDSIYFSRSFQNSGVEKLKIPTRDFPIGISRLTVFNNQKEAQCERLVFLNKHKRLTIKITSDQTTYMPREKVEVMVKVTDENGKGVAGDFSLSVSDDKLLTFADDKQGHILSKVLLESELKGDIHEPNFYFDETEENADAALDLLMMTHGWRRFQWKEVFDETEDLVAFPKEQCIIAGMVTDSMGNGISNAVVMCSDHERQSLTDAQGRFEFKDIVFGSYGKIFTALIDNNVIGRKAINSYGADFNISMTNRLGNLLGYLYNEDNQPCRECDFEILQKEGTAKWQYKTDRKGAYSILNIEAGDYKINLLNHARQVVASGKISILPFRDNLLDCYFSKDQKMQTLTSKVIKERKENLLNSWAKRENLSTPSALDFDDAAEVTTVTSSSSISNISSNLRINNEIEQAVDNDFTAYSGVNLESVVVTGYKVPLIEQDHTSQGNTLTSEEIRRMPTKNISALAAITAGLSQLDEGDPITIRGSRSSAIDYYIDGVRVSGNLIPASDVDEIEVITGGKEARFGGGVSGFPGITQTRNPKIPQNEISENIEARNLQSSLDNGLIMGGSPPVFAGRNYRYFYRPAKVYAMPSTPAVYRVYSENCLHLKDKIKKQECYRTALLEDINRQISTQISSHILPYQKGLHGKSANIQFVVDKKGLIGDIVVSPDDIRDRNIVNNLWYAVSRLKDWKPAYHKGFRAGSIYNIQIHYEQFDKVSQTTYRQQRLFYTTNPSQRNNSKVRNDFRSTIYWDHEVKTNKDGEAKLSFKNSDDLTKFNITVEGFGSDGSIGRGEGDYTVASPFNIISKVPTVVATMDTMNLPVTLVNNTDKPLTGKLKINAPSFCRLNTVIPNSYTVESNGSKTIFLSFSIIDQPYKVWNTLVDIRFETKNYYDAFKKPIDLIKRGFPHHHTFTDVALQNDFEVEIKNPFPGSIKANFRAHPSPISEVSSAMEKIIRQPGGCFEQTTSSNYPNLLALQLMDKTGTGHAGIRKKANGFLKKGYNRLIGFESKGGGFSLFGRSASDPGLSAMGLMQFSDMSKVYPVKKALIERTAKWLMNDRSKKGGWKGDGCGYYSKSLQRDFYILWAMSEAGYAKTLKSERNRQYQIIAENNDPYLMALLANALLLANDYRAEVVMEKLINLQKSNGGWAGAERSVSYSRGKNLEVETTALVLLALTKSKVKYPIVEESALHYLLKSKNQYGFGSTQSTVLALKSIIAHMDQSVDKGLSDGNIELLVNGNKIRSFAYTKKHTHGVILDHIPELQKEGKHNVSVRFEGTKKPIPFELEVAYQAMTSQENDLDCALQLNTEWSHSQAKIGETIRLTASIQNLTKDTVATPLAIIGIPGGLSVQPWQLKEIQDKGLVEYFEVEKDCVVFYLNHMAPETSKEINLDLKAELSGSYQCPASQAYLYYDNDAVSWAISDQVEVVHE